MKYFVVLPHDDGADQRKRPRNRPGCRCHPGRRGVHELAANTFAAELLKLNTQKLLRWHWAGQHDHGPDQIAERIDEAATRRFPRRLQEAHTDLIADGRLHKGSLAWMLGIDAEALEVDEPPLPEPINTDQLADALGL